MQVRYHSIINAYIHTKIYKNIVMYNILKRISFRLYTMDLHRESVETDCYR